MRVHIGRYPTDIIPVRRWVSNYEMWRAPDKLYLHEDQYTWYDKIVLDFFDKLEDFVRPLNRWSNRRKRKVKVHVDYYDIWSVS